MLWRHKSIENFVEEGEAQTFSPPYFVIKEAWLNSE